MKFNKHVVLLIILAVFPGCNLAPSIHENDKKTQEYGNSDWAARNRADSGAFKNLHEGDKSLAGTEAYQTPIVDNALADHAEYEGKHPGTVNYHFWNGEIIHYMFSPDGKVIEKQKWKHQKNEEPGYYCSWDMVDFSTGSDPGFLNHKDPRQPNLRNKPPAKE